MNNCIQQFYDHFNAREVDLMLESYHPDVIFSDPAFGKLHGQQAHDMWRMLVSRLDSKATISVKNIQIIGNQGTAEWTAHYLYGKKKRPVTNHITARFVIKDNKIVEHHDHFNLWKWSTQALGLPGMLFGWSTFFKTSLQRKTNQLLTNYINHRR